MEEMKKMDESTKSEELAERVELTDEQLDQASGGWIGLQKTKIETFSNLIARNPKSKGV